MSARQAARRALCSRSPIAGRIALAFATLLATACGSDASAHTGNTSDVKGPLYLVSTSVLTNDQATSYMVVTDSLAAGPRHGLDNALEFGGGARAYGSPKSDVVYVTSSEEPTLTEVTSNQTGHWQEAESCPSPRRTSATLRARTWCTSFSTEKAYFVSQETREIV
jgi:hypothetical protein